MPGKSALFEGEKNIVKSTYPPDKHTILYATPARIYFAYPQQDRWSYGGLQGALAFIEDLNQHAFFLKLVDIFGNNSETWSHELYEGFQYHQDQPLFHSFAGDKCMIGLVFADQKDAKLFYKKVTTRKAGKVPKSATKKSVSKGGKVDKSMISGPVQGSFKHVGHMGYDQEKGFVSQGVDNSWETLASGLVAGGFPEGEMHLHKDFIKEAFQDAPAATKKKVPPPVPRRVAHGHSESVTSTNGDAQPTPTPPVRAEPLKPPNAPPHPPVRSYMAPIAPPPPPPTRPVSAAPVQRPPPARPASSAPAPPPPAPPARPANPPQPPTRPSIPPPPPPPPPPSTSSTPPPPPPPPPLTRTSPPPPPPPPPPPLMNGSPPPPPPPAADGVSSAPPPPPAPPALSSLPLAQPGRTDLLASIRGQGVHNLRKTPKPDTDGAPPPPPPAPAIEETRSGGGDLTAALAAALLQRNKKLGESDDEDDDDEEWD